MFSRTPIAITITTTTALRGAWRHGIV